MEIYWIPKNARDRVNVTLYEFRARVKARGAFY